MKFKVGDLAWNSNDRACIVCVVNTNYVSSAAPFITSDCTPLDTPDSKKCIVLIVWAAQDNSTGWTQSDVGKFYAFDSSYMIKIND